MQQAYYWIICTLVFFIDIIINYEMLFKIDKNKSRLFGYYRSFLIVITHYFVIDILWGIFSGISNVKATYIITTTYFITMAASVGLWCKVALNYLKLKNALEKLLGVFGLVFFVGNIICMIVNIFNPFFFTIDKDCTYHCYTGRYVSIFLQTMIFTIISIITLTERIKHKDIEGKRHLAILGFSVLMIFSTLLQCIFPLYPVYSMGLIIGISLIHVFIQEDEENEIRLKLEENTEIISNAGYGIWKIEICDGSRNKLFLNSKLKEVFGVPDVEMTPEDLYDFFHNRLITDRNLAEQVDYVQMLEGKITTRILIWKHPTKGKIYLRSGGNRQILQNGKKIISGYGSDITEQKLETDRLNTDLEEANKQAEAANKAKTAFLFNMSHDIRTPMNAIIGFTELLAKKGDDKDKREDYIEKIRNSSQFLLSLINNVLEVARIESGKAVLEEKTNDIENLQNDLFLIFEDQFKDKKIEFSSDVVVKNKYVFCDIVKLREIFLNILSNAYKYTPEGGKIDLVVREVKSSKPGYATFRTEITDTGIGMPEEFIPRIFDEFSRAQNMTYSKIEGTGLGMPIVKKLIDLMGGDIRVSSKLGEGTTFTVYLTHRISDITQLHAIVKSSKKFTYFTNKRILLAEDNELNSEIAMELLKEMGFEVEIAINGKDCVEKYEKSDRGYYDLILMDIQMPEMDGYEAAKAIRALPDKDKAEIPIIAMTANAFASDKAEALRAGMNEHLAKPINILEVNKTLGKFLN